MIRGWRRGTVVKLKRNFATGLCRTLKGCRSILKAPDKSWSMSGNKDSFDVLWAHRRCWILSPRFWVLIPISLLSCSQNYYSRHRVMNEIIWSELLAVRNRTQKPHSFRQLLTLLLQFSFTAKFRFCEVMGATLKIAMPKKKYDS